MNMALAEWCFALNYTHAIPVWEYTFYPKEYLYLKLESLFNKYINIYLSLSFNWLFISNCNAIKNRFLVQKCYVETIEKNEKIRVYLRPTETLNMIESYMRVMLTIENHGKSLIYNQT